MELDDLDNKFTKFNIKWFSLLYFMKIIDLFCNIPDFHGMVMNAKMWISKFLFEFECLPKL
jgi:hypothetical protein